MTGTDPTNQAEPTQAQSSTITQPLASGTPGNQADAAPVCLDTAPPLPSADAAGGAGQEPATSPGGDEEPTADGGAQRKRILIGSQRDPAAYRARRQRDWTPVAGEEGEGGDRQQGAGKKPKHRHRDRPKDARKGDRPARPAGQPEKPPQERFVPMAATPPAEARPIAPPAQPPAVAEPPATVAIAPHAAVPPKPLAAALPPVSVASVQVEQRELNAAMAVPDAPPAEPSSSAPATGRVAPPSVRDRFSPDLEAEFQEALGSESLDDLMTGASVAQGELLEAESKHTVRVVALRRDVVFVELGSREQGVIPIRQFPKPPEPGCTFDAIVQRFNPEDGLYELTLPNMAADVGDWSDLSEGMLVDAKVTGHNTGGLECEVNHIRGFIPISQVALYRVEDLSPFVGQHFSCIVTEANPGRRNLVLSRRAVLEREKEESRRNFLGTLAPGQVYQGTVRKLMDFGAFVELGHGVDGLVHVSQLAWSRVNHPKDVLTEGQPIQVKIEKINPETGKISLSHRDLLENPWAAAEAKFPPNSVVRGKVTKIMEFGAFVELESGVEGLVHISELAPKRVWRTSDVVHEGDEVEVLVLSVNTESQRMSLSMKALAKPEPSKKEKEAAEEPAAPVPTSKHKQRPDQPLRGGLGRGAGGDRFGLKW